MVRCNRLGHGAMQQVGNSSLLVTKDHNSFNTCDSAFEVVLIRRLEHTDNVVVKNLHKHIPDNLICRFILNTPFDCPSNRRERP